MTGPSEREPVLQLIEAVLDSGSWRTWDEPVPVTTRDPGYRADLERARERTGLDESVITGEGRIRGRRVAVVACEFRFLAGSIGVAAGERLVRAVERATAERLPLLAAPASGGTRMQEGTIAFVQMVKVTAAIAGHKAAGLPYLVYLRHPTTGGVLASWGSLGHLTAAEPGALIGFLGPRVHQALYGEEFPPGVQTAENLLAHGLVDAVLPARELPAVVANALDVLCDDASGTAPPAPVTGGAAADPAERRPAAVPEAPGTPPPARGPDGGAGTAPGGTAREPAADPEARRTPPAADGEPASAVTERPAADDPGAEPAGTPPGTVDAPEGATAPEPAGAPGGQGAGGGAGGTTGGVATGRPDVAEDERGAGTAAGPDSAAGPGGQGAGGGAGGKLGGGAAAGPGAPATGVSAAAVSATAASIRRSRRPGRPGVRALLRAAGRQVTPLSGTGAGEHDPGLLLALARIGGTPCVVLGHDRHDGAAPPLGPGGLREARRGMRIAAELGLPLLTVVDTAGAALSREAEEGGLAAEIARSLADLVTLPAPTLCLLLGQGAGGGALALLPADRVLAAEHAWLSPLPPEGASAILHRTTERADEVAAQQGVRSADLLAHGIVDRVVAEPGPDGAGPDSGPGPDSGSGRDAADDPVRFLAHLGEVLGRELALLRAERPEARLAARRLRHRTLGARSLPPH